MHVISSILKSGNELIVLIKPQFEAEKHQVGKGGIVRDAAVHTAVIESITTGIEAFGFTCMGIIESPILGGSGNKEFLGYFIKR